MKFVEGLNQLAIQLDSKQAKTSFGKLPLSDEHSEPQYTFGRSLREKQNKVFLGELTVQENMARGSPGPVYKYLDTIKYKDVSAFGNHRKLNIWFNCFN